MTIKYKGPFHSISGYGTAIREMMKALESVGINVITRLDEKKEYDTVIHHISVDALPNNYERDKRNIVYTTFETDRFPKLWVDNLNMLEIPLVFVTADYCKNALIAGGYKGKVVTAPTPIDCTAYDVELDNSVTFPDMEGVDYIFYSVMQLSARKNLTGSLVSYLTEFTNKEKVIMIIKFYGIEKELGVNKVREIIDYVNIPNNAPVSLIFDTLSDDIMINLHKRSNCYVSLHRSEGQGLPIVEAMCARNPVIVTGYSGNMEFCNKENSFLVDYRLTPVYGQVGMQIWKDAYDGTMLWADPDIMSCRKHMRYCYEKRPKNDKGYETVKSILNHKRIGEIVLKAIEEL